MVRWAENWQEALVRSLQGSSLYKRCDNLLEVTLPHLEAGWRGLVLHYILLSFKIRLVDILVRHCDFVMIMIIQFLLYFHADRRTTLRSIKYLALIHRSNIHGEEEKKRNKTQNKILKYRSVKQSKNEKVM